MLINPTLMAKNNNPKTTAQIFRILADAVTLYPKYTISQHLVCILRSRNEGIRKPYDWTDEELLRRVEKYFEELETDQTEDDA
jgi:hypothetical protein